jgi:DnaK suppressor protein
MALTKNKLNKFREIFEKQKTELLAQESPRQIEIDGGDELDVVQANLVAEMAERLSLRDKVKLVKVNNALKKINDGLFGICEECEEPIEEKRLIAVPDCTSCIFCAERKEKLAKQYRQ